jgi:hypothetical protein
MKTENFEHAYSIAFMAATAAHDKFYAVVKMVTGRDRVTVREEDALLPEVRAAYAAKVAADEAADEALYALRASREKER